MAGENAEERAGEGPEESGDGRTQYETNIRSVRGTINIGPNLSVGGPQATRAGQVAGEWTDAPYDVGAVRRLLLAAFTPQDLVRFCQDEAPFRPVVAYFGPGQGLVDMVDRLVDYCRTRALWDELLAAVKRANPAQFDRFAERLGGPGAGGGTVERNVQAERLATLQQRVRSLATAPRRPEALARVNALRQALLAPRPDLALLETTWHWFRAEMPPLAGPVLSAILAAGREIQQGDDDELWAEFQDRFGAFIS